MVAKAEVFESDVLDVEVGAPAAVTVLGRQVAGKVVRVGSIVGRNKINSLDPTALADRRVVEVTIRLDDPALASRLINMQVEAAIRRAAQGRGGAVMAYRRYRPRSYPQGRTPPLALRNVLHGGPRSLAAIAGIVFVVVMVLLQLGFFGAVEGTATNLYDELDFDIALIAPEYDQLYDTGAFPLQRLRQAESLDTVVAARPLYVLFAMWRCPPYPLDRTPSASSSAVETPDNALQAVPSGREPPPAAPVPRAAGDRRRPRPQPVPRADPRPDRGGQAAPADGQPAAHERAVEPRFRLAEPVGEPALGDGAARGRGRGRVPPPARLRRRRRRAL